MLAKLAIDVFGLINLVEPLGIRNEITKHTTDKHRPVQIHSTHPLCSFSSFKSDLNEKYVQRDSSSTDSLLAVLIGCYNGRRLNHIVGQLTQMCTNMSNEVCFRGKIWSIRVPLFHITVKWNRRKCLLFQFLTFNLSKWDGCMLSVVSAEWYHGNILHNSYRITCVSGGKLN